MHLSGLTKMEMVGDFVYVREYITAKAVHYDFPAAQSFYVEINLHKREWLISCTYNSRKNNICRHLELVKKTLDEYYPKCGNIIFPGEFNTGT